MGSVDVDTTETALADPSLQILEQTLKKYDLERDKRLQPGGLDQYVFLDKTKDPNLKAFSDDPWLTERSEKITLEDGQTVKHIILGAGMGGVVAGIRFIQAGADPQDVYLVDEAGGIGGAWYWNRYPGVTSDVESYTYLPLLQETGYMPKHNFSYGHEIRAYLETLAANHGLDQHAMFRTKIEVAEWDDSKKYWNVTLSKKLGNGSAKTITVRARFLSNFSGVLVHQKLPAIPGIASFKGDQFHIGRWNYNATGGSQENPFMDKLHNKRVAIVGTGASAVQGMPELAKHAKELYVIQRTPASVDVRNQHPTDPAEWAEISKAPNWWDIRSDNLSDTLAGLLKPGEPQLVKDNTTTARTYRAIFGGKERITPDQLPEFARQLQAEDLPRMERIRQRVRDTVKDPDTAARLLPWYTSWCKRPAFMDGYLDAFNQPNVHLIDTEGKGVTRVTPQGLVANGQEIPVDLIVWATGYRGPFVGFIEERSAMVIRGRNGLRFDDKWRENVSTLHGLMSEGFPNFFLFGVFQGGMSLSWSTVVNQSASHAAYIAAETVRRAKEQGQENFSVEPTREAEEAWSMEVFKRAGASAALAGCTPNYFNDEGAIDKLPMEAKLKMARGGIYGGGFTPYKELLQAWREEGGMQGLQVRLS